MSFPCIVVTGTDTGVGKTVFAAALAGALGAYYWKPVQSGPDADTETVARISGLPRDRILPCAYALTQPLSPHRAAELDGVRIDEMRLKPPVVDGPLVIEGAGGVLTPVTRTLLFADLFARWGFPVVVVARTMLGAINHTLMTVEALNRRNVAILGVAFSGEAVEDSEATIAAMGGVRRLGRLPRIAPLTAESLRSTFAHHFSLSDFR